MLRTKFDDAPTGVTPGGMTAASLLSLAYMTARASSPMVVVEEPGGNGSIIVFVGGAQVVQVCLSDFGGGLFGVALYVQCTCPVANCGNDRFDRCFVDLRDEAQRAATKNAIDLIEGLAQHYAGVDDPARMASLAALNGFHAKMTASFGFGVSIAGIVV